MKLSLNTEALKAALKVMKAAVDSKSATFIHMFLEDGTLTLRAADPCLFAEYVINNVQGTNGDVLVNLKSFLLVKLPKGEAEISVDPNAGIVRVTVGGISYAIPAINCIDRLPAFPEFPDELVSCPDLSAALSATAHAISEDKGYPDLMGFWLHDDAMTTCDGMQIAHHQCKLSGIRSGTQSLILHADVALVAKFLVDPKVAWDDVYFFVENGPLRVVVRRIPAKYRSVLNLVPGEPENKTRFTVNRSAWLTKLQALPKHESLRLQLVNASSEVQVTAGVNVKVDRQKEPQYQEVATAAFVTLNAATVDADHLEGAGEVSVSVKGEYLRAALQSADSDELTVYYAGYAKPLKLIGGEQTAWIMPLLVA